MVSGRSTVPDPCHQQKYSKWREATVAPKFVSSRRIKNLSSSACPTACLQYSVFAACTCLQRRGQSLRPLSQEPCNLDSSSETSTSTQVTWRPHTRACRRERHQSRLSSCPMLYCTRYFTHCIAKYTHNTCWFYIILMLMLTTVC